MLPKAIASAMKKIGMEVDENLAYGKINGFEVNVTYEKVVRVLVSFYADDKQRKVLTRSVSKNNCGFEPKYNKVYISTYGAIMTVNGWTDSGIAKRLPDEIAHLCDVLKAGGAQSGLCPTCGSPLSEADCPSEIDGAKITLCGKCTKPERRAAAAKRQNDDDKPADRKKGFLGALLGAGIGIVAAVIIYVAGFFPALGAIAALITGVMFYKRFAGKADKTMVWTVPLTTFVAMLVAVAAIYIVDVAISNPGINVFEALKSLFHDKTFLLDFCIELAAVPVISAIGAVCLHFKMRKSDKK